MEWIKEKEGVTEQLKATAPMEWIRRINEIKLRVERMVLESMVFLR